MIKFDDGYRVVTECEEVFCELGWVTRIHVVRHDGEPMYWDEIHFVFSQAYPGMWAMQMFPSCDQVIDNVNKYHLFVLATEPQGLNIQEY